MPLARIITRLPQETAALAEYLSAQGYTVETVSSPDDDTSTPADLEISAEQYPLADALARAREIAARGWDIMVAPGVLDGAPSSERPAELIPEPAPESVPELVREVAMNHVAVEAPPVAAVPMDTVQKSQLPRRKMTRNWNSAWTQAGRAALSRATLRAVAAGKKISAAAALVLQTSRREAARIAGRWKEFAATQRSQSAQRAANIATKMKEIRRLREEREALETAARLRQREAEREARIRQAREREERARLLQAEAERESQRRAEHAAQIEAAAEQARVRELQQQRQLHIETEREECAERAAQLRQMQIEAEAANSANPDAKASANGNKSADVRRSSRRRRDWEMAFAGAAAATVVLVFTFGVLGARRPAEKFAPTHAVEQQLPFGTATIHPAASTAKASAVSSPPVVKANPPVPQSAPAVGRTAPKLVADASGAKRRNALPNNDSFNDADAEVVVRHFAPQRAPATPPAKKSSDGVKRYSDIE